MADTFNASNKKISAQSFFGGDKVEKYRQELVAEGRIPGTKLNATAEERRQGFTLYRKNKIEFKNFVEKVLQKKTTTNYYGLTKNGNDIKRLGGTGAIVKARPRDLTIFEKKSELSKVDKSSKNYLGEIIRLLNSISSTLQNQFKFDKKKGDYERKEEESDKRKKREGSLESVKKINDKIIDKVVAPFKSIIDRIWNFILYTFLGREFTRLMNWLGDEKNKKKIKSLIRFFKDWWPAIITGALAFFTPLGSLMATLAGTILGGIASLAMVNPVLTAAIAAVGIAGLGGMNAQQAQKKIDDELLKRRISEAKKSGKQLTKDQIEKIKTDQLKKRIDFSGPMGLYSSGGSIHVNQISFANGGGISRSSGLRIMGAGPDTQLIAAKPGEIMMNTNAVNAIGADNLLRLNSQYGGSNANKPKYSSNIQFAANGGVVGGKMKSTNLLSPNSKLIFNRLVKGGLTPIAAAGIVSNIGVETGYTYDPNTHQMKGGPGRGLVQWEKGGRFDTDPINLSSFAGKKGKAWNDLNTQIDFILHELNHHPEYKSVKRKLNKSKNITESIQVFLNDYEKAGEPHIDRRLEVGKQLIKSGYLNRSKPKEKAKPQSWIDNLNPMNWFKNKGKQGGGLVKENTGMNIFGATADRQLTALQPGEYVLPTDTVSKLGSSLIDRLVAMTDSNSSAAKIGGRKNRYVPGPLSKSGKGGMMTLPPITQSMGGGMGAPASGTSIPSFSAVSSHGAEDRSMNASIYGIVG